MGSLLLVSCVGAALAGCVDLSTPLDVSQGAGGQGGHGTTTNGGDGGGPVSEDGGSEPVPDTRLPPQDVLGSPLDVAIGATSCKTDNECAPTHYCNGQQCLGKKETSWNCDTPNQCKSGFCVTGVCCESACTARCASCNRTGQFGHCQVNPPVSMVAQWHLDETSGTIARDSSCLENHATLVGFGGGEWRDGKVGGALTFNGTSAFLQVPDSPTIDSITSQLTIAMWFHQSSTLAGTGRAGSLFSRTGGGNVSYYNFLMNANNNLQLFMQAGPGSITSVASVHPVGVWTHLAVTYANGTAKIYLNGQQIALGARVTTLAADVTPVTIGAALQNGVPGNFTPAIFDEVLLYKRALQQAEIAAIVQGSPPPR